MTQDDTWVKDMLAHDKATAHLGIRVVSVSPGEATVEMKVTETMCNGHLTTHGGYVFLLADTAFAFACNAAGEPTVAAGAQIRFIKPTHAGDRLTATATERGRWGKSGIYDVTVRCNDDVIAEFRGDSHAVRRPSYDTGDPPSG